MLFLRVYNNTAFSFAKKPENRGQDGIRYFYSNGSLKLIVQLVDGNGIIQSTSMIMVVYMDLS